MPNDCLQQLLMKILLKVRERGTPIFVYAECKMTLGKVADADNNQNGYHLAYHWVNM